MSRVVECVRDSPSGPRVFSQEVRRICRAQTEYHNEVEYSYLGIHEESTAYYLFSLEVAFPFFAALRSSQS